MHVCESFVADGTFRARARLVCDEASTGCVVFDDGLERQACFDHCFSSRVEGRKFAGASYDGVVDAGNPHVLPCKCVETVEVAAPAPEVCVDALGSMYLRPPPTEDEEGDDYGGFEAGYAVAGGGVFFTPSSTALRFTKSSFMSSLFCIQGMKVLCYDTGGGDLVVGRAGVLLGTFVMWDEHTSSVSDILVGDDVVTAYVGACLEEGSPEQGAVVFGEQAGFEEEDGWEMWQAEGR